MNDTHAIHCYPNKLNGTVKGHGGPTSASVKVFRLDPEKQLQVQSQSVLGAERKC